MDKKLNLEVSERWIEAIEQIIVERKARNYIEIQERTGVPHQRISAIKRHVQGNRKLSAYAGINYIIPLCEAFNVNAYYILSGVGPIFREGTDQVELPISTPMVKEPEHSFDYGSGVSVSDELDNIPDDFNLVNEVMSLRKDMDKVISLLTSPK